MSAISRDQQKGLIREVLREQAFAAATSGSQPPAPKATLYTVGRKWVGKMRSLVVSGAGDVGDAVGVSLLQPQLE